MVKVIALTSLLFLTACQTVPKGDFCDIAKPIRVSQEVIQVMTDQEVAEALAHNQKGARLCKWKA